MLIDLTDAQIDAVKQVVTARGAAFSPQYTYLITYTWEANPAGFQNLGIAVDVVDDDPSFITPEFAYKKAQFPLDDAAFLALVDQVMGALEKQVRHTKL